MESGTKQSRVTVSRGAKNKSDPEEGCSSHTVNCHEKRSAHVRGGVTGEAEASHASVGFSEYFL